MAKLLSDTTAAQLAALLGSQNLASPSPASSRNARRPPHPFEVRYSYKNKSIIVYHTSGCLSSVESVYCDNKGADIEGRATSDAYARWVKVAHGETMSTWSPTRLSSSVDVYAAIRIGGGDSAYCKYHASLTSDELDALRSKSDIFVRIARVVPVLHGDELNIRSDDYNVHVIPYVTSAITAVSGGSGKIEIFDARINGKKFEMFLGTAPQYEGCVNALGGATVTYSGTYDTPWHPVADDTYAGPVYLHIKAVKKIIDAQSHTYDFTWHLSTAKESGTVVSMIVAVLGNASITQYQRGPYQLGQYVPPTTLAGDLTVTDDGITAKLVKVDANQRITVATNPSLIVAFEPHDNNHIFE